MDIVISGIIAVAVNATITAVIAGIVNRWLKKRDEEAKEIIDAIKSVSEKVDALKSEFAVYQLTALEKYASKDDLNNQKNENTTAHKEFWETLNILKNDLTEVKTMINLTKRGAL
jgi:uncharacterized coiled-coil DUF342 family protein